MKAGLKSNKVEGHWLSYLFGVFAKIVDNVNTNKLKKKDNLNAMSTNRTVARANLTSQIHGDVVTCAIGCKQPPQPAAAAAICFVMSLSACQRRTCLWRHLLPRCSASSGSTRTRTSSSSPASSTCSAKSTSRPPSVTSAVASPSKTSTAPSTCCRESRWETPPSPVWHRAVCVNELRAISARLSSCGEVARPPTRPINYIVI